MQLRLNERDRRAVTIGACALGAIVLYFGLLEPAVGWYADLRDRHASAAGQLARLIGNERKAASYQKQIEDAEKEVGPLSAPMLSSEEMNKAIERITLAAGESQVEVKGVSPGAAVPWLDDPALQRGSVLIDAQADWPNALKLVDALYHRAGILSVERLELAGDAKQGGKQAVKLTVSVLVAAPAEGNQR